MMTLAETGRNRAAWQGFRFGLAVLATCFVAALAIALLAPAPAIAEEGEGNNVDPTQRADNSFIYDTTI